MTGSSSGRTLDALVVTVAGTSIRSSLDATGRGYPRPQLRRQHWFSLVGPADVADERDGVRVGRVPLEQHRVVARDESPTGHGADDRRPGMRLDVGADRLAVGPGVVGRVPHGRPSGRRAGMSCRRGVPKLSPMTVRPWGMEEFYVWDPHGNILKFGRNA